MKKLIVMLFFVVMSISVFAQSTPVSDIRVATATTPFNINLPVGTKVYNIATKQWWTANTGVLSTATLTTAAASFDIANPDISGKVNVADTANMLLHYSKTATVNAALAGKLNVADTAVALAKRDAEINARVKVADTAGMLNHYAKTITVNAALAGKAASNATLTLGSSTLTLGGTTTTVAGLTSVTSTAFVGNLTGNASGTAANVTGTVAVANGGTGATTLTSGSYVVGNGTGAVTLKTPAQVLADIGAASAVNSSVFYSEPFEESTTGATGQVNTLAHTPKAATAIQVLVNGTPLKSTQYTYTSATPSVQITIPVYQYDKVVITYGY